MLFMSRFSIFDRFFSFFMQLKNRILGYSTDVTDLVGYETMLAWLKRNKIALLDGDVVEIGCFLGGGTAKLAKFFDKYNKKVFAVDIFEPSFDNTKNLDGNSMSSLYSRLLRGRNQKEVFNETIKKYTNVVVLKGDSKQVALRCSSICFSFIDGCHDPDYVRSDFYLVWDKTVSGGVVGFHDYGGNLPQTTLTIDELIKNNKDNIKGISRLKEKWVILLTKR